MHGKYKNDRLKMAAQLKKVPRNSERKNPSHAKGIESIINDVRNELSDRIYSYFHLKLSFSD